MIGCESKIWFDFFNNISKFVKLRYGWMSRHAPRYLRIDYRAWSDLSWSSESTEWSGKDWIWLIIRFKRSHFWKC
jgi:hypothetical protein